MQKKKPKVAYEAFEFEEQVFISGLLVIEESFVSIEI